MDAVYSAALRRVGGDAHLARDVAQEVFVLLSRHAPRLVNHRVLAAWLYTTTRNTAVNMVRGECRRKAREQEAQSMQDLTTHPERSADWREIAPLLDQAVDRLNETDRRVVILRFFDRHTFVEIGAMLRVTEDSARMRADRALEKLRRLLARHGIQSSGAALGSVLAQHAVSAAPDGLMESAIHSAEASPPVEAVSSFNSLGLSVVISGIAIIGSVTSMLHERANRQAVERAIQHAETQIRDIEVLLGGQPAVAGQAQAAGPVVSSVSESLIPQLPTRMAGGRKLALSVIYADLYRNLGLTPGQIERFESVHLRSPGDGVWTADVPSSANAYFSMPLTAAELVAQTRDLLGEAAFQEYENYNRLIPAHAIATHLAGTVYLTDPVSPDQAAQLTRILASASASYQAGGTIERTQLKWDEILAEAKTVLRPAQIDALEAVRRQEEFEQAMLQEIKTRTTTSASVRP
jgi:RNA polymerase sigma factor (sigma-70 family)